MTINEFADRLGKKFPKGANVIETEDLSRWLRSNRVTDEQLDDVYSWLIDNYPYRTFPMVAEIKKGLDANRATGKYVHAKDTLEATAGMTIPDIVSRWRKIRSRQDSNLPDGGLPMGDIDFIHAWDDLVYIYDYLTGLWHDDLRVISYLEPVKERIIRKERINFDGLPKEVSVQEERVGKMVSFDDLEILVGGE